MTQFRIRDRLRSFRYAAAAVLISAVGAAIVGVLVFWPHMRLLLAGTRE
ncbi:MAG: hypothetical protein NTV22_13800 [bacterium]|nr:hypothetical protein [bacterium]